MLCIVCGVYRYRQKQLKEDPHWQMPVLPRSRAGSSRNLRTLNYDPEDDSDTDASTLKKVGPTIKYIARTNHYPANRKLIFQLRNGIWMRTMRM